MTEIVKSPSTESGDWGNPTGAYTKDDGQYANEAAKGNAHTYDGYGFTEISGEVPAKVEVGVEGYGDGDDYVELEASWDGGTSWTTIVSHTPPTSEPSEPVYVDVTNGRSWTWDELSDTNFRVRITKRSVAKGNPLYIDWLPIKVTSALKKVKCTIRVTPPPDSVGIEETFAFEGVLTEAETGLPVEGKVVDLYVDGDIVGTTVTGWDGSWGFDVTIFAGGTYSLYAEFLGDATHEGCP